MSYKNVLIALCGKSPAVITETAYLLAKNEEEIPDEVIVITTSSGKQAILDNLVNTGIWLRLKSVIECSASTMNFGNSSHSLRVIPKADNSSDAFDIISSVDTERTANFILDVLRQYSENPETRVTFSIAGGRKTMSAIGALAMSLLGRYQDRLCHITVSPPYDSPLLEPKFYFPEDIDHKDQSGEIHNGLDADLSLSYIPFPCTRYLFENVHGKLPGNYTDLVLKTNKQLSKNLDMPEIHLDPQRIECYIGRKSVRLSPFEFALYWMLILHARRECPTIIGGDKLYDEFHEFVKCISSEIMPEIINHDRFRSKNSEDLRKAISSIESKIKSEISLSEGVEFCLCRPERGRYAVSILPDKVSCPEPYR